MASLWKHIDTKATQLCILPTGTLTLLGMRTQPRVLRSEDILFFCLNHNLLSFFSFHCPVLDIKPSQMRTTRLFKKKPKTSTVTFLNNHQLFYVVRQTKKIFLNPHCKQIGQKNNNLLAFVQFTFPPLETREEREQRKAGVSYPSAVAKGEFCFARMLWLCFGRD